MSSSSDPWYTGDSGGGSPSHQQQGAGVYGNHPSFNQPQSNYNSYNNPTATTSSPNTFHTNYSNNYMVGGDEDFDNEPPLLEELDIRFDHILDKTKAVMFVNKSIKENILDDADLAGPIFFCLLLGSCLLLSGKVHFGYIYGFSVFGCAGMWTMLNLLDSKGLDIYRTCSVLGYSLIPVISLAALSIFISNNIMQGFVGLVLSIITIMWSTYSATRIFDAKLQLTEQFWLIAYPVGLFYSCFVLITIF